MHYSRARNTNRIHVDSFQVIRICVVRLLSTVRIKYACDLKELFLDVGVEPSWRDCKGAVCAVSRPSVRNTVRLDLQSQF
jgi:hypothetical protein